MRSMAAEGATAAVAVEVAGIPAVVAGISARHTVEEARVSRPEPKAFLLPGKVRSSRTTSRVQRIVLRRGNAALLRAIRWLRGACSLFWVRKDVVSITGISLVRESSSGTASFASRLPVHSSLEIHSFSADAA